MFTLTRDQAQSLYSQYRYNKARGRHLKAFYFKLRLKLAYEPQ